MCDDPNFSLTTTYEAKIALAVVLAKRRKLSEMAPSPFLSPHVSSPAVIEQLEHSSSIGKKLPSRLETALSLWQGLCSGKADCGFPQTEAFIVGEIKAFFASGCDRENNVEATKLKSVVCDIVAQSQLDYIGPITKIVVAVRLDQLNAVVFDACCNRIRRFGEFPDCGGGLVVAVAGDNTALDLLERMASFVGGGILKCVSRVLGSFFDVQLDR